MKSTRTLKVTTPSDREMVLTRTFRAPRTVVCLRNRGARAARVHGAGAFRIRAIARLVLSAKNFHPSCRSGRSSFDLTVEAA
jgi:hypothetical protein